MNRRRSKRHKNSFSRWKNFRKNSGMSESHLKKKSKKKQKLQARPSENYYRGYVTSEWYWSNYRKAINYWKSHQMGDDWEALRNDYPDVENIIKKYLPSLYLAAHKSVRLTPYQTHAEYNSQIQTPEFGSFKKDTATYNKNEEGSSEEIELEMSEEMIEFFKVSFQHKLKLEKEKQEKEQKADVESKVNEMHSAELKRNHEMKLLYGEEASKIIGMETALQLSYDKYCDTKLPKYWPNIPLRLK